MSVFGVFLMRQSIEVIPNDYIDAARIDGSSELGIFWRVILSSALTSRRAVSKRALGVHHETVRRALNRDRGIHDT
ncbi:MAG: ABC transporter permease subunit [Candidatus Rokuibacteriota bacterium]